MKNIKETRTLGRRYNKFNSLCWAVKRLACLDGTLVVLMFAIAPVAVTIPLVRSWFSKVLIDSIGNGAAYSHLALVSVIFLTVLFALNTLKALIESRCDATRYYPTTAYKIEQVQFLDYTTDYENCEKQDFRELEGYVKQDHGSGNSSLEFVRADISGALTNLLGIAAYGSILAFIDPLIFAIVAVTSVLSYFPIRWQQVYYEKHKHEWEKETRKKEYLHELSDNFPLAKDIKLYALGGWLNKMMRDYQAYILIWNKRCSLRGVWAAVLSGVLTLIQDCAAYIFLVALLFSERISVGDFVFYFSAVGSIAAFLTGVVSDVAKLSTRAEKISYYRTLYDYPDATNHGDGCPLPAGKITIELKDVWYMYSGAEDYTIKGLNLTIEGGESIALVGMNGAGKSTLVNLICGLYTPTKGEILVNGRRIEEYNIEEYFSLISAVFQKNDRVAFTILEFISSADLSRPTAREDAVAALKGAGLWEKIENLPNGIDTHLMKGVYDDGVELSGGEMQKLLLARAIYKNGSILILDEPSAALDPIAENDLYLQYRELTKGKTSLYISHRFASTRFCDRIILLENGIITESGSHDELMARNGRYAYMFGEQSKYYKEGEVHA